MEEKILKILEEQCEEILDYEGENMLADGVIDSFTIVNIVIDIENELDIENFRNKETIIALVKRVMEEQE